MKLLKFLLPIFGSFVAAHPGEDHTAELTARQSYFKGSSANLSHCSSKLNANGVIERAIHRRSLAARGLKQKRALLAMRGEESRAEYTVEQDPATLFGGNSSCAMSPEEMVGPYYVEGEYVRSDLVEEQEGIPLELDIQFIDASTCKPVEAAFIDIWNCNSTGVYGGVIDPTNGNGAADPSNVYNTWLRGVQKTDVDGVVQFSTLFPGHYTNRTVHIHVMAHLNAQPLANGTLFDTEAAYVSQIYFDQDLINSTNAYWPYSTNTQPVTTNSEDFILKGDLNAGGDPQAKYMRLGSTLEDGILAWITFGINVTHSEAVTPAATYHPALNTSAVCH